MSRLLVPFALSLTVSLFPLAGQAQPLPGSITIGSAPAGGVQERWGLALARLLRDTLGVRAAVEVTGGPVHAMRLLDAGQLDIALLTAAAAAEGWTGTGWARGLPHRNVRVILAMYPAYFHMYAPRKSGIRSLADLQGKRVGVGPAGGTAATYWPAILEAAGVRVARLVFASSADLANQLRDGLVDAHGQAVGLPWPVISEIESRRDVTVLGVPPSAVAEALRLHLHLVPAEIPAGTYRSQPDAVPTLATWNVMAVHRDAADALVTGLLGAAFGAADRLAAAHLSARELRLENIWLSPIPLHPAAVRFFRERGIALPDRLVSTR